MTAMQEEIISWISEGFDVDGRRIYARNKVPCKLKGAFSIDVYLQERSVEMRLLTMTAYSGQRPYYRPWVELFCINNNPGFPSAFQYYDSGVEESLLREISRAVGPGGKIFIEYYSDIETSRGLAFGYPPAVTRQGYRLLNLGFSWFKDWYFSEGGHEGGQKLQGEMPMNAGARGRQMEKLKREIAGFLDALPENTSSMRADPGLHQRAVTRASQALKVL